MNSTSIEDRIRRGVKRLKLHEDVYEPAEDTFLLAQAALENVRPEDKVLEVGTGSGFISMLLSDLATTVAADISPSAVRCARDNGVRRVVRADLFKGLRGRFDLVLFNAPYLPTKGDEHVEGWLDQAFDGGQSGRRTVERFLDGVGEYLTGSGRFLLLISSLTGIEEVERYAQSRGFTVRVVGEEKLWFERLVVLEGRLCGSG